MAPQILTYQLTLISTRAGEGRIMPNKFLFVPHTSRISRPSYSPATEMMLINNVRMLIEMQWGMLTGFQNTLFFNALSFHTTYSVPGGTAVLLHFTCVQFTMGSRHFWIRISILMKKVSQFTNWMLKLRYCYFKNNAREYKDWSWGKLKPRKYLVKAHVVKCDFKKILA